MCEFCDFTRYVSASKAVIMYHGCTHSISSENMVLERRRGGGGEERGRGGRQRGEGERRRGERKRGGGEIKKEKHFSRGAKRR